MKLHLRNLLALLLVALLLPGCSMLTANGRRQAAYAHYVAKYSKGRVKQQKMFHSNKPSMPVTAPEEQVSSSSAAEADSGPQSVAANVP
jgi:hypothetical protein